MGFLSAGKGFQLKVNYSIKKTTKKKKQRTKPGGQYKSKRSKAKTQKDKDKKTRQYHEF